MPFEDDWKSENASLDAAKAYLGSTEPNDVIIAKLKEKTEAKGLADITSLRPNGVIALVAHALDIEIPESRVVEYKRPPHTFLNPVADRQAQLACQNVPIDPELREILSLRREGKVRALNAMERSTLVRLERKPADSTPAPIPASIPGDKTLSAVQKGEKARQYQQRLVLNRRLLDLRGNEARLRGEGQVQLAGYVRDQIAQTEAKIKANGG